MKRVKRWVKVSMVMIITVGFIAISNNHANKAIEKCVSAGHSQEYCEAGLK